LEQLSVHSPGSLAPDAAYILEEQIGFILRQATQRHVGIFSARMTDGVTPTQFAVINMLDRLGSCSQNHLGRLVAMDAATVKGVIDRLVARGITRTAPDSSDARLLLVTLTEEGRRLARRCTRIAAKITEETLAPLTEAETRRLLALLKRLT
jgi:DNA-binding MarR family transcriptional regulator